ncbi:histidine kinase [Fluviicola sp.]|uniref:sensor histidine kinase n=1 Tax=Fluviicola sp. TaxID=1917219 RepID=UPI003D28921A
MHFQLIKDLLWGIFFVGITSVAAAQGNRISWEYNYDHFGIENGLPSSESYQVYQDRSGLLWILTDRGVVRYDGFEFHKYTVENGLSDNVNFRIVEDPNGGIWFVGYNGLLSVFKDGKMEPYRYNHVLKKNIPIGRNSCISLYVKKDSSIVYSVLRKGIIGVSKNGKVSTFQDWLTKECCFFDFGNGVVCSDKNGTGQPRSLFFVRNGNRFPGGNILTTGTTRALKHKGHYFIMTNTKLYLSDKSRINLLEQDHEVISLDADDQFLYVGIYKNGLKKFKFNPLTNELVLVKHYLPNYSVSSAYKDFNGTLWMTTLEKGLFSIYDEAFRQLAINEDILNEEVRFINGNKDKIILTHYVGKWQQLYSPFLCKDAGKIVYKYNLVPFQNEFAFEKGIVDWSDWKDVNANYTMNPSYSSDFSIFGMSRLNGKIGEMKGASVDYISVDQVKKVKVVSAFHWFYLTSDQRIFLLFDEGIFVFDIKNSEVTTQYRSIIKNKRFSQLSYNKVWGLLASSNTAGIFRIDVKREKAAVLASNLHMGNQILNFCFDEKNRLWVAAEKGLFLLENRNGKVVLLKFLNRKLLSSAEITDLYSYNDVLYLTTKFGVQKIDFLKVKREKTGCPIELVSIRAFAKNKELGCGKVFPSKTDLIEISLSNKNLSKQPLYKYRFGKDETWISADKGEIIVNNPSDGDYSLEISYLDMSNHWSKPKVLTNFTVEKIIFLRWYFILIYITLVGILFYAILRYTVGAVNRKNHLLNRMMELERMALAAQMNPHFIFNSLNSIHSFLLYEENENAEKYLIRFARLIRQTLANSRMSFITIEEECETLKNYILLEKMRFKDVFTFTIECEPRKMPAYPCIPPMLIQPYVENAILHGLVKRPSGGKLFLKLYQEDDLLKVLIEDNGIGYLASKKEKKDSKHKSYGTQITEERLKSLQGKNSAYSVSIDTVDSSDTEFPGTRVIVTIPINMS